MSTGFNTSTGWPRQTEVFNLLGKNARSSDFNKSKQSSLDQDLYAGINSGKYPLPLRFIGGKFSAMAIDPITKKYTNCKSPAYVRPPANGRGYGTCVRDAVDQEKRDRLAAEQRAQEKAMAENYTKQLKLEAACMREAWKCKCNNSQVHIVYTYPSSIKSRPSRPSFIHPSAYLEKNSEGRWVWKTRGNRWKLVNGRWYKVYADRAPEGRGWVDTLIDCDSGPKRTEVYRTGVQVLRGLGDTPEKDKKTTLQTEAKTELLLCAVFCAAALLVIR